MENHVGNPLILEGNIFFPETGIPIWNKDLNKVVFAVALPEPLTVQIVMQKSLTFVPCGGPSLCAVSTSLTIKAPSKSFTQNESVNFPDHVEIISPYVQLMLDNLTGNHYL